jgi:hypothetical protein
MERRTRSRAEFEGLCDAHGLVVWHCLNFRLPWHWKLPWSSTWKAYKKLYRVEEYIYQRLVKEGWFV